jgi:cell division protein FtsN
VRAQRRNSRTGTFLVLAGIVGVLTTTFVAGVWTGHNWPALTGNPRPPVPSEASAPGRRSAAERPRADTLPALTFYSELTAPLTAPPPPPKPVRPPRPPEPKREPVAEKAEAPAPPAAPPARATLPPPAEAPPRAMLPQPAEAGPRFTIQVAAYNVRPLAETLRSTLAAAGHDARVVENEAGTGARYRVQVGTFPTRVAAREAAARLAAERSLSTFVTTR